jgi:hypothetical protein
MLWPERDSRLKFNCRDALVIDHSERQSRLSIPRLLARRRYGNGIRRAGYQSVHPTGDQTMRFLSMIRVQENTGKQPSERLMAEMGKLMGEMTSAGKLLDTAGLAPTAQGKRVRLRGGRISIVDGPFTETKEVVGGYAMLNADSLEEAIALTERFVELHVADGWEIDCEVRQVFGPDFG